jgi:hypothetical protein
MNAREVVGIAGSWSSIQRDGLLKLHELVSGVTAPGAVVECGVCNGGAAAVLWHAAGTERRLWLFDSFEGMPQPMEKDGGRAFSKYTHRMEAFGHWNRGEVEIVKSVVETVGPLERVEIVKGWVEETLPVYACQIGAIAVLHLDMDFYSPTITALNYLYPLVSPGGLVIFDDYNSWAGCKVAADEYMQAHGLRFTEPGYYIRVGA